MQVTTSAAAPAPATAPGVKLTTNEMAIHLRTLGQSVRSSLFRNGHYLGMRPVKLPNGKLLWDANEVARLVSGEGL